MQQRRRIRIDQSTKIAPTTKLERAVYRRLYVLSSPAVFTIDLVLPVIASNQEISKRLLSFVNSSGRVSRRRVTDLRHAIILLGANGIREFTNPVIEAMDENRILDDYESRVISEPFHSLSDPFAA